ncbi:ABC transporter substrate-binding protein [Cohnella zeiphila]|uniref:Sugar ABC transporter substrate-binding protein n=1 Tax=Cohnella zeiphila TaxID=2761120 RepID=A0A7X0VU80_9BACL|nr:sugar ABC transporter substrate-binding protein [Cohnella zeiphila]MBB6730731.1 sugar ABC transporter substrate-binding protein [Cohnella zeiphila]
MAKTRWKRSLLLAATGVLGASALAGCSGGSNGSNATGASGASASAGSSSGGEKVQLSFETSVYAEAPHKKAIDALIQKYNEMNPNVEITVHGTDYENFWDKLTTEIIAGTQGDIVQVYPENIATYNALQGDSGAFVNLDDRIKGTDLETDLVGQELSRVNGSYYALSNYAWGTTGIFYRKSLFEKAGIDPASIKTLDDFKAAAIKLGVDANGDGTIDQYGFSSVVGSHPFVASEWYRLVARPVSGGVFFGDGEAGPYTADRINVNSPANVWAAKWWQDLMSNPQATPPGTRDKKVSREMFWNGQAAMIMDGPWFIGMTKERDAKLMDDLGLIPQPDVVYEGKTYKPNPHNYPLVSMISQNSKHKDEAWKFMEWMASPEAQEIIAGSGMIPSSKAYAGTEAYASANPLAAQFFDFQDKLYAPPVMDPPIPELGTLSQTLVNAAQDMFVAKQDARKTLDKAAAEMKKAMN